MIRALLSIIVFFVATLPSPTQFVFADAPVRISRTGDEIKIQQGRLTAALQFVSAGALRVLVSPDGAPYVSTLMLDPNVRWAKGNLLSANLRSNPIVLRTSAMTVRLDKTNLQLRVFDAQDRVLITQTTGVLTNAIRFSHHAENFYGVHGYNVWANTRNKLLRNEGGSVAAGFQGDAGAPLIYSTKFGLLADSIGGKFEADAEQVAFTNAHPTFQPANYFVLVGAPKEIMRNVLNATGRPPMLPKWALGFMNFEWGTTQAEVEASIQTYRAKNIPVSAFGLDFDYKDWGADNYGEFRWNAKNFPDGASGAFAQRLNEQGVKLVGIMKPRIISETLGGVQTQQAKWMSENDCWYPNHQPYKDYFAALPAGDVNFAKPNCRAWYWDQSKKLFATGISGWWNDEADIDPNSRTYDDLQGMNMARAMYEGQRSISNRRVFTLNRNFYLGAQRFAYGTWSGDIEHTFDSMAKQRERMLSSINVGATQWSMDVGGFTGTQQLTPEAYAKWMQFGVFAPLFRVHGYQNEQRQPWLFGAEAEEIATRAIRLRQRLLPYIYSYQREAYETGIGLVRPMFWEFPDDPNVANMTDQWMFGEHFLVAPVVTEGQTERSVYLPEGDWVGVENKIYKGGGTVHVQTDFRQPMIVFIRAGALAVGQESANADVVEIFALPSEQETEFVYYDDDGETYDYERGVYFRQRIRMQRKGDTVELNFEKPTGTYKPAAKTYKLRVTNQETPMEILVGKAQRISLKMSTASTVAQRTQLNLAHNKPTVLSSQQDDAHPSAYVTDGDSGTRWASQKNDHEFLFVDLGATYVVSRVVLNWERAVAKAYQVQVSNNPNNGWTTLFTVTNNLSDRWKAHDVSGVGRYVRINMTERSGEWGYSLYDLEVYGSETPLKLADAPATCVGAGSIQFERWNNVAGTQVSDLTGSPRFGFPADVTTTLAHLEFISEEDDGFGARAKGFVCPPRTGVYTFWVSSDDSSELRLNNALVASVAGWTLPREWRKYAAQQSLPIFLEGGRTYPIELLFKEGANTAHVAVAWEGPGFARQILRGQYWVATN